MGRLVWCCGIWLGMTGCAFLYEADLERRLILGNIDPSVDTADADADTDSDTDTDTDADTDTDTDTDSNANTPPVAIISGTHIAYKDQARHFDGSESYDPDGDTITYVWDFGDGNRDEGSSVEHTFREIQLVTVTLTVDDGTERKTAVLEVEVAKKLKVDKISPNKGEIGDTLDVTIEGDGFFDGADVTLSEGITVDDVVVESRDLISARVEIGRSVEKGKYDIVVTNIDGVSDDKNNAFEVEDD